MCRKILVLAATLLLTLIVSGNVWSDVVDHGGAIMRPDHDTLRRWIADYEKAPKAPIDEAIKSRLSVMQAGNVSTSLSLLSHVPYLGAQRNQQQCGNCWVWAGTGLMEIAHSVQNSVHDRLSIQYLDSCKTDRFACNGGNLTDFAGWYEGRSRALPWSNTNASFADGSGPSSSSIACGTIGTSPNYPLVDFIPQTIATTGSTTTDQAIVNIKNVLNQSKGVWFAFWLANSTDWNAFYDFWNNSAESVLWNPDPYCGHTWDNVSGGGHAVMIVGYNDDDENVENHYWTVLNSWGVSTGRPQGTFRMKMNMNYGCMLHETGYPDFYNNQFQTIGITYSDPCAPSTSLTVPANSTGTYTVSWGASSTSGVTYVLEESTSSGFTSVTTAYSGTALTTSITKTTNGTFYYRVKATKSGYPASDYYTSATGCVVAIPGIMSYVSGDVPKTISDNSTVTSTLTVPAGACASFSDINVNMNITHTYVGDLGVSVAHNGSTVQLFNRSCSSSGNLIALFDDEATTGVQCPPNGAYQPYSPLSAFDGLDPSGTWTLSVTDNANGDTGTLNTWGIDLACASSTHQLSVAINGNGSVNSNPTGIACSTGNSGTCSHQFANGTPLTLTATGINGSDLLSHFGAWQAGVCDSVNGAVCSVTMSGDKNITATFITNQPVRIPVASYYPSLQAAYNEGSASCTIMAQAVALPALPFTLNLGKTITLEGGYDCGYSLNNGSTILQGILTLGTGSLTVENLIIK